MRLLPALTVALALAVPAAPAYAADDTAKDLYERCSSDDETLISMSYCLGMIRGLIIGAEYAFADQDFRFCYPDRTTNGDFLKAFLAYYRANPAERLEPAFGVVALSVAARWPCKK
jgi:hypothetical protein